MDTLSYKVLIPHFQAFLDVAMLTAPKYKRPHTINGRDVEKYILRKAFDEDVSNLPEGYDLQKKRMDPISENAKFAKNYVSRNLRNKNII